MEGNSACSLGISNVSIKKITGPSGEGLFFMVEGYFARKLF